MHFLVASAHCSFSNPIVPVPIWNHRENEFSNTDDIFEGAKAKNEFSNTDDIFEGAKAKTKHSHKRTILNFDRVSH